MLEDDDYTEGFDATVSPTLKYKPVVHLRRERSGLPLCNRARTSPSTDDVAKTTCKMCLAKLEGRSFHRPKGTTGIPRRDGRS